MGKRLAANVAVDGVWYGPAYPGRPVLAEVAERIGEHAWEDDGEPEPERAPAAAAGKLSK